MNICVSDCAPGVIVVEVPVGVVPPAVLVAAEVAE